MFVPISMYICIYYIIMNNKFTNLLFKYGLIYSFSCMLLNSQDLKHKIMSKL